MSPGRVVPAPLGSWSRQLRHQLKHGLDTKELTSHENKHLCAEPSESDQAAGSCQGGGTASEPFKRRPLGQSPAGPGPPDQNRWPGRRDAAAIEVQVTNLHPQRPRISPNASARGSGARAVASAMAKERSGAEGAVGEWRVWAEAVGASWPHPGSGGILKLCCSGAGGHWEGQKQRRSTHQAVRIRVTGRARTPKARQAPR